MLIELPFSLPGKIFRSPMPFSRFDKQEVWPSYVEEEIGLVVILTEQQEYLVSAEKICQYSIVLMVWKPCTSPFRISAFQKTW